MSTKQEELVAGTAIWVNPKGDASKRVAGNFQKMSPQGDKFQAKVNGKFLWYTIAELGTLREVHAAIKAQPSSESKAVESAPAGPAKEAQAAAKKAEKEAAAEAKKAEKEALKAQKIADKEAKKAEREAKPKQPKKSRGTGKRLAKDLLAYLKAEVTLEDITRVLSLSNLAEDLGKREEDIRKAAEVLETESLVELSTIEVAADEDTAAFSYAALTLTPKGLAYEKASRARAPKEGGEQKEPMQKRIAEAVRELKTNEEIIAELSTEDYTLSRTFVSTVRSRMRNPEAYKFNYAIAEDATRDYLAERKAQDAANAPKVEAVEGEEKPKKVRRTATKTELPAEA